MSLEQTHDIRYSNNINREVSDMQIQQGNNVAIQVVNNTIANTDAGMADGQKKKNVITYGQNITYTNHFIGREREIRDVLNKLKTNKRIMIRGLGGIGKTTILQKIYHFLLEEIKNKNKDMQIGYFDYELSVGYTIYKALGFEKTKDGFADINIAAKTLQNYCNNRDTVILIDNVPTDRHKELHELDCYSCWIIITSRQQDYENYEKVNIEKLSLAECVKLFQKESGYSLDGEDLEYIIEKLIGRHTLTIKIAARILKRNHWPVEKLKTKLEDTGFNIDYMDEGEEKNLLSQYKKLYSISELNEHEISILEIFSLVRHAKLKEQSCIDILEEKDVKYLNDLYEKGWLEYEQTNLSYSIHPVFAELISEIREINMDDHRKLFNYINQLTQDVKEIDMPQKQEHLAEIISFARYVPLGGSRCKEISSLLINCAKIALVYTEYHDASIILKRIEEGNENFIHAQLMLIDVYVAQSRFKEADAIFSNLSVRIKEDDGPLFIDYTIDYAIFKEKSAKSDKERGEAISMLEAIEPLEMDEQRKSCIYNCLGGFYTNLSPDISNFKKSLIYHQQAQQIREKYKDGYPMDLARTYNNMANNYYYLACKSENQDEYLSKAEEFYEKSLELRKRVLNENHPDIARVYVNLGNVYLKKEQYDKALKFMEQGLKIRQDVLGENTKETGLTYRNMIRVYLKCNDWENADNCRKKAEKIYIELYKEDSETYLKFKKDIEDIFSQYILTSHG